MGSENLSRLSWSQLERLIRERAQDTSLVFVVPHANLRMVQRRISLLQVHECLRNGVLRSEPEEEPKSRSLRCVMHKRVAGRPLKVAVELDDDRPGVVVITAIDESK